MAFTLSTRLATPSPPLQKPKGFTLSTTVAPSQPKPAPSLTADFQLLDFQQSALPQAVYHLAMQKSCLLTAATGLGKTYFIAQLLYELRTKHPLLYGEDKPILLITRRSLVIQTSRVMRERGIKNIFVISINQLRSTIGLLFLDWRTKMVNGEPTIWPYWREDNLPCLVVCDEAQMFKNMDSNQSKVMRSWNLGAYGPAFFSSATPYSRPLHTRVIASALGCCRDDNWPEWVSSVCGKIPPKDWNPRSMRYVQNLLEPRTIRFEGVKYKHVSRIHQLLLTLPPHKRVIYDAAMAEYQKARVAALENELFGMAELLVAMIKFRQKAELLRAEELADMAVRDATTGKKNVIVAVCFVETLRVIHSILVEVHNYPAEKIGVILGGQKDAERQGHIDGFQCEALNIMLMTFTSGGAGLSLHNTPKNKRPRTLYLPPVWSAEELIQLLGRAHRINSQSTTHQYIVWFADTIEEHVANTSKKKCTALKEVVGRSENWVKEFDRLATEGASRHGSELTDEQADMFIQKTRNVDAEDAEEDCEDLDCEGLPVEVGEDIRK